MMKRLKKPLTAALSLLFWVGIWWLISLLVGKPLLLPTPWAVLKRLFRLTATGAFWQTIGTTLLRISAGLLSALALGLALALLTVRVKTVGRLLAPPLYAMKATPVVAVIFLLLLWFGKQIVPALVTLSVALPIVFSAAEAALARTDRTLLEMARAFGVPTRRVFWQIKLPAAGSALLAAVRASVGLAFKAGVAAEVLAVPRYAIGTAIFESNLYLYTDTLFAYALAALLLSALIEWLVLKFIPKGESL
ncbi:MAG: ABC transporter permease subunit [Clostridia bacterium]|nr:ABC transporter permease subunit [Clostridia bacterium]